MGVTLLAESDSSGPPAWDPKKHPLVFITSLGPGYGGLLSDENKLPCLVIIDAETYEVVASRTYDLGWESPFEPHGLGVSPDGQFIYLPTGDGRAKGRYLIINTRTLKIDKVLATTGRPHHASSFIDSEGNDRVLLYGWEQPMFVLDPKDNNRVVGGLDFNKQSMEGYLYFATPDGDQIWAGGRWRSSSTREDLHDNIVMVIDTKKWEVVETIAVPESNPIWITFTLDGKTAFVSGGHTSSVMTIDRETFKTVRQTSAGVLGPYGIRLNWDETELWAIGKGESSHNRGKVIGLIDLTSLERRNRAYDQFVTNCIRGDHLTLHPDPSKNELWLSCNSSFEVVIFSMTTYEVIERIPLPMGASTHSGAFVQYNADFTGQVLSDPNGLHGPAKDAKKEIVAARE